jgi:serine/threonine protein kinase
MAVDSRVQELLDEICDSGRTPEEVCATCPELLPEVRRRWRQMCAVKAKLHALFPTPGPDPGPGADTPVPWHTGADLPQIPGYDVEALLGCGGMGLVYKARQLRLDRLVALKFLPREFAQDPLRLELFRREARTASSLNHPHICTIYDIDEHEGPPFLVMELIQGRTLREVAAQRPSLPVLVHLIGQVAQALAAAHAAGIIHRDIKPENIMVRDDGYVEVIDFGLSRPIRTYGTPSEATAGEVMIRNNKQCVTDLQGKRLFQAPRVSPETFQFSPEEEAFYELLTTFITTGQAYASRLDATDQRIVILILIAMQKLASSSVAAIRRALAGRLRRIEESRQELDKLQTQRDGLAEELKQIHEAEESADFDSLSVLEEQIAEHKTQLSLMEDEEPRLKALIQVADKVQSETKIEKILGLLDGRFAGRTVLFFTEYKATQALLMSAIIRRYGDGCVTFFNGDEAIDGVVDSRGQTWRLVVPREQAASRFNSGMVRFLVSTEAAGEGIDLQGNCHTLIHVDLPWNPMRMHQRVGRLNRYGQTQIVDVVSLRNPN